MVGSLTPYWSGFNNLDHYAFTDSSGAEYRLNQDPLDNIWKSQEGIYIYYDSFANRLYFPNGSFWVMGCSSAGEEDDAGTVYPTVMQDSNGNQILIRYDAGVGTNWLNSGGAGGNSYQFAYDRLNFGRTIPHLTSIANLLGTGERYTMHYAAQQQALNSPFAPNAQFGTALLLTSAEVAEVTGLGLSHVFGYDAVGSGELTQVTFQSARPPEIESVIGCSAQSTKLSSAVWS